MSVELWLSIAGFFTLIVLSAFFAGAETALTAASKARMHTLEGDGNARARLVNKLREKREKLIGGLLLGNTMVNIAASSFATLVLVRIFGEAGVAIATVVVSAFVLVFAEVMPKTYAMMHADRMSLVLARPVAFVLMLFTPITIAVEFTVSGIFRIFGIKSPKVLGSASEEELRGAIELFNDSLNLEEDQERGAMLRSILDLADVKVEEIMTHRKSVKMVNVEWPPQKIVNEVLNSTFTRMPVWKESSDNIMGIIHVKLLLQELARVGGDVSKMDVARTMLDPWFIPESTTLFDQLQAFRKRREHFAVMVDEYGALMGVITLEDILEEIVGQIDDEHDTAFAGVRPQPDGSYSVDGNVTIRDLNRALDWDLPDDDYSTVAGLVLFESQRIPNVGQTYGFFGYRFEIVKKNRNQIVSLRIFPPTKEEAALAEAHA